MSERNSSAARSISSLSRCPPPVKNKEVIWFFSLLGRAYAATGRTVSKSYLCLGSRGKREWQANRSSPCPRVLVLLWFPVAGWLHPYHTRKKHQKKSSKTPEKENPFLFRQKPGHRRLCPKGRDETEGGFVFWLFSRKAAVYFFLYV